MKKRFIFLALAVVGVFWLALFSGCEEETQQAPPPMNIIEQDPTGTMGELSVNVYYRHGFYNDEVSEAPDLTDVHLYASAYDLDHGIPLYRTYLWGGSHTVYFGFLDTAPEYQYYVLAFATINGQDYEAVQRIMITSGAHTNLDIIMEKLETDKQQNALLRKRQIQDSTQNSEPQNKTKQ